MSESWDEKSDWMRKVGAVQCGWNDSGDITSLVLGPAPAPPPAEESVFDEEDRALEEIQRKRAILLGAAGGAKHRLRGSR